MPRIAIIDDEAPVTAAAEPVVDEEPAEVDEEATQQPASPYGRFRALLTVEGVWTGDRRQFGRGALEWAELPLPLMGTNRTTMGHEGAVSIGHIDRIERAGDELWGYGAWAASPEANLIRQGVRDADYRGVSVDVDSWEWELVIPPELEEQNDQIMAEIDAMLEGDEPPEPPEPERDDEGNLIIPMPEPRERVTKGRVIGATVVPFPAFQEGQIFDDDPDYELVNVVPGEAPAPSEVPALVAAGVIAPPVAPPLEWFARPSFSGYTPWTITDEGQVFGHVAAWDACHISFPDFCQAPPRSASQYAHFLHGEVRCDDGTRVPVGQITMGTGHADTDLDAWDTIRHYDHTGTAAADVFIGEDEWGIWAAGALRPGLTPEQVRVSMAAGVSGDWRWIAGNLELVAVLNVNVPGFSSASQRARGMVASGVARSLIVPLPAPRSASTDPNTARRVRALVAAAAGRTPAARRAELRARIHPEAPNVQ